MQKIVFFGSAEFSIPTLEILNNNPDIEIILVVTKPDKPAGRGMQLNPTPVKTKALELNLPVMETMPTKNELESKQINLLVVVAYGLFIPAELFENWHCVNLHPSLLPKYRGPSPLQTALLNGDSNTGVTTMLISQEMDAGDILMQEEIKIDINMNIQQLHDICAQTGAKLIEKTLLSDIEKIRQKQDDLQAIICKKIQKDDRKITPGEDPWQIHNKVRAISGFVELQKGTRVKILKTTFADGNLTIEIVQPEGKPKMSYTEYLKGHKEIIL